MDRAPQALLQRSPSVTPDIFHAGAAATSSSSRARFRLSSLFDSKELDFAALAASDEGITVMQPRGKRVGAQLPQL